MKKTGWMILVVIAVLLAGALWLAYSTHEEERIARMTTGEAEITFVERTHDFGNIAPDGGPVHYDFEFTNTGSSPLVISEVATYCGCVSGEFPLKPVKPGKKGHVKITYDPSGKSGAFTQTATVVSNASNAYARVTISGNVIR